MITRHSGIVALLAAALLASMVCGEARAVRAEASRLRIKAAQWNGKASELVDPANAVWKSAASVPLLLNLTPRIAVTDKPAGGPPKAVIRCAKASDATVVRLTWTDATRDQPNIRKPSPADPAGRVRVMHTQMTDRSYDAAAVMVPVKRNPAVNPCIQMGDKAGPVELYFWHAIRGPAVMHASGRATTLRTRKTFPSKAVHASGQWQVTFVLPRLPEGTHLAFAIWDGSKGQRGGLKWYSLWHSLR